MSGRKVKVGDLVILQNGTRPVDVIQINEIKVGSVAVGKTNDGGVYEA